MFDYEWASAQHHVNCRLATRVLVPDAIPAARLRRYGAKPPKLVQYPGLKEEYFLAEFEPDASVLDQVGADPAKVVCVVRTAPSYALYLGGSENPLLPRLLEHISRTEGAQAVVIARTPEQASAIDALGYADVLVPRETVDGRSLVALADLLVSAGGTMNREAAVLGTPVWSIFEGKPGAVDEQLIAAGRLRMLDDPADLAVEKKADPDAWRNRVRRDPAELLALAVPVV
jgi:predicted glycosyltransferase